MKLKEIEIGEEYACGSPNQKYGTYDRRRVVAIDKFKKPHGRRNWSKARRRRVKAVYIRSDGSEGGESVLDAQEIIEPWAAYAEKQRKEKEASKRRAEELQSKREDSEAQAKRIASNLQELGLEMRTNYNGDKVPRGVNLDISHRYGTGKVSMNFDKFEELLETIVKS